MSRDLLNVTGITNLIGEGGGGPGPGPTGLDPIQLIARRLGSEVISPAVGPYWPMALVGGGDDVYNQSGSMVNYRAYFVPCWLKAGDTIDQLAARVANTSASVTLRVGLYADNGNRYPGIQLLKSGDLACNLSGFQTSVETLAPSPHVVATTGLYWGAFIINHTASFAVGRVDNLSTFTAVHIGSNAAASQRYTHFHTAALLSDANLPDPAPAGMTPGIGDVPVPFCRFSAFGS